MLDEIDKLLAANGLEDERLQLEDEVRASFLGGELCSRVGSKLLALQKANQQVGVKVGSLINEFSSYCNHCGIYPD
jgi:hypothetical protein